MKKKICAALALIFMIQLGCAKAADLPMLGEMPEFQGIEKWFNSQPLNKQSLKGKVVLVDFWTYSCINCIRTLPYIKAWHEKYKDAGLVIIGVHSPEFEFEKNHDNIQKAIQKFGVTYPVAVDNQMATWRAYNNQYWPAHYFIDAKGKIRFTHFGEGEYEKSEQVIQELLREAKKSTPTTAKSESLPTTIDFTQIRSPETYLGFLRRENFVESNKTPLKLNQWTLEGDWETGPESIRLRSGTGKIRFRFHATKVNLVLHPPAAGTGQATIRLDGSLVSKDKSGRDVVNGQTQIGEPRLYELINLGAKGEEHTVEIEVQTPGVAVYAFTFG